MVRGGGGTGDEEDVRDFDLVTADPSVTKALGAVTRPCGQAACLSTSRGHRQGNSDGPIITVG